MASSMSGDSADKARLKASRHVQLAEFERGSPSELDGSKAAFAHETPKGFFADSESGEDGFFGKQRIGVRWLSGV